RFDVWGTKGYSLQVRGRNRRLPGYKAIDLGSGLNSSADVSISKGPKLDAPVVFPSHWLVPAVVAVADSAILGLVEVGGSRIAVYGDSNCLDSSHMVTNCYWLLRKILDFTGSNVKDPILFSKSVKQKAALHQDDHQLPSRRTDLNFSTYSAVVGKELTCRSDSRFDVWGTKGYSLQVRGRNRRLPGYKAIDPSNLH
nr:subtilisin-like protease SBT6.1 [Tanacetum cinerariifolium]